MRRSEHPYHLWKILLITHATARQPGIQNRPAQTLALAKLTRLREPFAPAAKRPAAGRREVCIFLEAVAAVFFHNGAKVFVGEGQGVERVHGRGKAVLRKGVVGQDFEEDFEREVDQAWHRCGAGGGCVGAEVRLAVGVGGKMWGRRDARQGKCGGLFVFHSMRWRAQCHGVAATFIH